MPDHEEIAECCDCEHSEFGQESKQWILYCHNGEPKEIPDPRLKPWYKRPIPGWCPGAKKGEV